MHRTIKLGIFVIIILATINLASALTCNATASGSCSGTMVLYITNNTGGWYNAHAQNVSGATYGYGICCDASADGETVTTGCSSTAPTFLKLSATTNAHVEVFNGSAYTVNACIGVTNRNVSCTYNTTCSSGYTCLASIASSNITNNLTNAHIDANCSSSYPIKICCGYNSANLPPIITFQEPPTPLTNTVVNSSNQTIVANITDPEGTDTSAFIDFDGSLVGYWSMDYYNNTGISDNSTYNNFGTFTGGMSVSNITTGVRGKGLTFNGSSNYLELNVRPNIANGVNDWTISAWAQYYNTSDTMYAISSGYAFQIERNTRRLASYDGGYKYSNTTIAYGTWTQVAIVCNQTNITFYINGVISGSSGYGCSYYSAFRAKKIGTYNVGGAYDFNGSLDEVMIFNRSLSSTEISALYNSKVNKFNATFTNLSNRLYNYTVYAIDTTGNMNKSVKRNFTVSEDKVPVIQNASILPSPAYTNASLVGYCNATDADGGSVTYNFKWYKNGVLNVSNTTTSYTQGTLVNVGNITNASLAVGQNWTLECQANDSILTSNRLNSSNVTIQPRIPSIPTLFSPSNNNYSLILRQPILIWNSSSSASWYEINITSNHDTLITGNVTDAGTTNRNYTPTRDLYLDYENGANTYYNWTVRACNVEACSNWANTWNFSITTYLVITLINGSINFPSTNPGTILNTTALTPTYPFQFRNDGNVFANMTNATLNQSSFWSQAALNTRYLQMKVGNTSEGLAFDNTTSMINWTNVTQTNNNVIRMLNYSDSRDSVFLHLLIEAPGGESAGSKAISFTFNWLGGN